VKLPIPICPQVDEGAPRGKPTGKSSFQHLGDRIAEPTPRRERTTSPTPTPGTTPNPFSELRQILTATSLGNSKVFTAMTITVCLGD